MGNQDDITTAIEGLRSRLDTLASITASNILIPGGPQERYHEIVEEAYATLGLIETQIDELRTELEYQHKRLDETRDARLSQVQGQRFRVIRAGVNWRVIDTEWRTTTDPIQSEYTQPETVEWFGRKEDAEAKADELNRTHGDVY